jgi:hypothetical protein
MGEAEASRAIEMSRSRRQDGKNERREAGDGRREKMTTVTKAGGGRGSAGSRPAKASCRRVDARSCPETPYLSRTYAAYCRDPSRVRMTRCLNADLNRATYVGSLIQIYSGSVPVKATFEYKREIRLISGSCSYVGQPIGATATPAWGLPVAPVAHRRRYMTCAADGEGEARWRANTLMR